MKLARPGMAIAAAPPVLMLAVFYSLAIHMHRILGGWPTSIGERGFPPKLILHCNIDMYLFSALFCSVVFVLPVAVVVCGAVPRWRWVLPYLACYLAFFVIAAGLMQLAPAPFLDWWYD